MTEQVAQLMKSLDITEAEALELIADDEKIENGEKLFELSPEQEANSKKARATGTRKQIKPVKRERKIDNDKRFLIDSLFHCLTTDEPQIGDNVNADNVEITNPEREINFVYNDRKFKIILSAPRT